MSCKPSPEPGPASIRKHVMGPMLLAVISLLMWDLDSLQPLFQRHEHVLRVPAPERWITRRSWAWLGMLMLTVVVTEYALGVNLALQLATCLGIGTLKLVLFGLMLLGRGLGKNRAPA